MILRVFIVLILTAGFLLCAPPDFKRVRNPKALQGQSAPTTLDGVRSRFADPPSAYRSAPLWVWNDEMDWPYMKKQLGQFKDQGMGGVFVHPRPGLLTEYLTPHWFDLWRKSLEEGKRLGLLVHIYDENSYPSGFAGGHVPSMDPSTSASLATPEILKSPGQINWTDTSIVAVYAAKLDSNGRPADYRRVRAAADFTSGEVAVLVRLGREGTRPFSAGFSYIDITNPRSMELFLKTTYEAYYEHFGSEFGKTILWAFTDEPRLPLGGASVALSMRALAEFQRRRDYDLADHLPSLLWEVGDYRKVRFDYWELMHDLAMEAFFEPVFTWCDEHNLQFTGHWWEHTWPSPSRIPSDMSFYAFEHAPGIDLLGFQARHLEAGDVEPHMLLTIKMVSSVANQLGRPRVLSESYGGGGWGYTLETMKRVGDYQFVHGVNLLNQHLVHSTIRGARKRDWPQSFSEHAAWWPYYRKHGDYVGRVSLALSSGQAANRVLVLMPTTSAYLEAGKSVESRMEEIRRDQGELVQFLADHQVDFDLGDEYLLDWFGSVNNRKLVVGEQAYDVIVWPKNMNNLRGAVVPLLEKFTGSGGKIIALSDPAPFVDGRPSDAPRKFKGQGWRQVSGHQQMLTELHRGAPPKIEFDRAMPPGLGFAERILENGDRIVFLTNSSDETVEAAATIAGGALEEWNTETGEIRAYRSTPATAGKLKFSLKVAPAGSLLLAVRSQPGADVPETKVAEAHPLPVAQWSFKANQPNVLVLDYCDYEVGGKSGSGVIAAKAAEEIFRAHGFKANPWDGAVQFRQNLLDRNPYPAGSGFKATYHFQVEDATAIDGLELAIESPELYAVRVNGKPIDFSAGVVWLDRHFRRVSIASAARQGANTVEIVGRPFDVRMELDSVYLLGKFGVRSAAKGFVLAKSVPLDFGSWASQGRPFFSDSVTYGTDVTVDADGHLVVELGDWNGSVVEILIDGKRGAVLGWPPWNAEVSVTAGKHRLEIRVMGTPNNLFGLLHDQRTEGNFAPFPAYWRTFADLPQPPGTEYRVIDYGLFTTPSVAIRTGP